MADLPYPLPTIEHSSTQSIADGLFGAFEHIAEHLTDLERKSRELSANYQHLEEQLHLASQIQRALLPTPAPQPERVRFDTLFHPIERVSGDIYDITRLDETHLGISLADATGHGVPAALLTVFIKRAFKGKEIHNGSYSIVPPDEILRRLNRELQETRLKQCPYVTALHVVYDEATRRLTFARGGTPHPVCIPASGAPRQLTTRGGLVGAFADTDFELAHVNLEPGDRVLFFSDGLPALLCGRTQQQPELDITRIPWFLDIAHEPAETLLAQIEGLREQAPPNAWNGDDITVISLEVNDDV